MPFRISALSTESFEDLFDLSDKQLEALGARRIVADRVPGFPCRVSLLDAAPGESVILTTYHHVGGGPFRAAGPIYVREGAKRAEPAAGEVPGLLRLRTLSVRAYDAHSMMIAGEVAPGSELETVIERLLGDSRVRFLHLHFAGPGCFACRVDRAAVSEHPCRT